jgi:uncharacterized protein YndB with AHSA1/START domain
MNQSTSVSASVRISATPDQVFPYFIDASLLARWMGSEVDIRPEPGGVFAVNVGTAMQGTYVVIEPPRRVVFTWGLPGNDALPSGASTVEILLTADGEETVVDLIHHDLPADLRADHLAGWISLLSRLRDAVPSLLDRRG